MIPGCRFKGLLFVTRRRSAGGRTISTKRQGLLRPQMKIDVGGGCNLQKGGGAMSPLHSSLTLLVPTVFSRKVSRDGVGLKLSMQSTN